MVAACLVVESLALAVIAAIAARAWAWPAGVGARSFLAASCATAAALAAWAVGLVALIAGAGA